MTTLAIATMQLYRQLRGETSITMARFKWIGHICRTPSPYTRFCPSFNKSGYWTSHATDRDRTVEINTFKAKEDLLAQAREQ